MTDDWQYLGEEPEVECVSFRCKTHSGAIRILQVPEGWTWAIDCHRLTGDVLSYAEPLGRRGGRIRPDRLASSRDLAMTAAIAAIRARMPDKPLGEWLDTLIPDQPDLFGEAA